MDLLKWLLPAFLSLALGASLVQYLTVHPLKMARWLFLTSLLLSGLVVSIATGFRGAQLAVAALIALAGILAGYTTMARRFFDREDHRPVPALTRAKGDRGKGHTAVVYFTHGEPETYDPIGWINQFNEFDEQGIRFVPFLARPYFIYKLRNSYLKIGKSDHRKMHIRMLRSLEQAYREAGDSTTRFYLSFLDDVPRPDAAVIQALNDGASRIVVAEVFLTVSNHTAEGEELIDEVDVEAYGAELRLTGPMYDSETLKSMFVQRANQHLDGVDKSKVGILLVGHGQPDEWDKEWGTLTQHELSFREEIMDLLVRDGFKRENMSLAWMMFKEPKPGPKIEEFATNGVERLLYFPAAISADAMHSQYDIPELVGQAQVPDGFPMINMGAWNDDPIVIRAIKEKIDAHMGQ